MNFIEVAGRLGNDPEARFTPNGQKVTTFSLATNQRKGGKDVTIWWRITVWGDRFDKMMPYLKKGSATIVKGELAKPEIYQNREGNSQVSLEITADIIRFNPFGKGSEEQENNTSQSGPESKDSIMEGQGGKMPVEEGIFSEDEIPF